MKTCRKNVYVIRNKDCYTATCNDAVHNQCIEHQSYNKIYKKKKEKRKKKKRAHLCMTCLFAIY